MNGLDEFTAVGDTHISDGSNSGNPNPNGDVLFLARRRLFKLEKITALRNMPPRDPAWARLKGKNSFYKGDADVRLWANLLNAILTAKASMFTISWDTHTALIEADKLLKRKTQGKAYNIVIAFALDPKNNLLEEIHRYSKEGDPKHRARLLRVVNPIIRGHLAQMVGGEDKLVAEERRIQADYEEDIELEREKAKSKVAKGVGDGDVPPVAPKAKVEPTTKKNAGPARINEARRIFLRDGGGLNWKTVASDKNRREQRLVNMRGLVLDVLKSFDADDFDEMTFEQMAHCFISEKPGDGADEEKWRKLVSVLMGVARQAFKAETGRTVPKPKSVVDTVVPAIDEPITVFEGELLGINDPP